MIKRIFITVCVLCAVIIANAAQIDTIQVYSASMKKNVETIVLTPSQRNHHRQASANELRKYPVVYLLHGAFGNAKSWLGIKPKLGRLADMYRVIIVCPDGQLSWYWDSPVNNDVRYETFISSELISHIDSKYPTIADRNHRAITGLSMGGHGAMYNALRHHDVFGAVGSMSGGLDIRPFPQNWGMKDQLGEMAANKDTWDKHSAINQIDRIQNGDLAITIDCGEADFFLEVNKEFHQRLLGRGIDHDFTTRPGGHTSEYWNNSLDYHMLFFKKVFNKNTPKP